MRANTILLGLIGAAAMAMANAVAAQEQPATVPPPVEGDTLVVPAPTPTPAPAAAPAPASVSASTGPAPSVPARGSTMDGVKAKFGAPSQEGPPVGTPAITRWDYAGFAVFFENDKVLHTVISR